jgi:hypothetical protein
MDSIANSSDNDNQLTKRPTFLTVLCILTFISTGIGAIGALITPLMSDTVIAFMKSSPNYDEAIMSEAERVIMAGWIYYAPTFLLVLVSLIGALFMWKLKKIGFHLYAASNLALLFLPLLVLGIAANVSSILFTVGFIVMYGANSKQMH